MKGTLSTVNFKMFHDYVAPRDAVIVERIKASGAVILGKTDRAVPLDGNLPIPKQAKSFLVHMAQAGPLARNIEDLEMLWKLIVGPHESDRNIPTIEWKPASGWDLRE